MAAPNVFSHWIAATAAVQVLAWRLPMLALMAIDPTPRRRREAVRMVAEKQQAAIAGSLDAQAALMRNYWTWCSGYRALAGSSLTPLAAANVFLAPSYRTAKSNARRLRKRKRM